MKTRTLYVWRWRSLMNEAVNHAII